MKDGPPPILLCASRWYPLSARLALALLRHGAAVAALCPPGHPLRLLPGIQRIYKYRSLNSLGSLKAAILSARPEIIVPCDDGVVLQLHALREREPSLAPLIEASLGKADAYPIVDSRDRLLRAAAGLGIRVPRTWAIGSEADLARWPDASAVLKTDGSMGGEGTAIARSPEEMAAAYREISRPAPALTALKRTIVNARPLSLWMWRRAGKPSVTIQQFIPGTPANTMIVCWRGEMLASVTVEVLQSQGATGAATVVRLVRHREIEEAACKLARHLTLTGFYGLDFILEQRSRGREGGRDREASGDREESRPAYLIEMNPRCTQLGHLRLHGQGDLAGILSARLRQQSAPCSPNRIDDRVAGRADDRVAGGFAEGNFGEGDLVEGDLIEGGFVHGDTIAFFPQALLFNPDTPYLHRGHHDVPWESPQLVRELLLEEWPDRQPAARLYHWFRKRHRSSEAQLDGPPAHTLPKKTPGSHSALT